MSEGYDGGRAEVSHRPGEVAKSVIPELSPVIDYRRKAGGGGHRLSQLWG
jgi:hypothetical protein